MRRFAWALPGAAALLAFRPALRFGFVNFDDEALLLQNPFLSGARPLSEVFTRAHASTYAPLCWLALRALGTSLVHPLLLAAHAACAALVFLIARELYRGPRRDGAALFAALLFALHPVQAECAGEAACIAVVPAALLALVSVLALLKGRPRLSLLLFAASLLWHWEAVALPVALLALRVAGYPLSLPGSRMRAKLRLGLVEALPFLLLSVCAAVMNAAVKRAAFGYSSVAARPNAAARGVIHALGSLLRPGERLPVYVYSTGPRLWESGLLFLALCGVVWLARKKFPALAAAWISFVALLAPPLLLTGSQPTWGHDHFFYLACVPLFLLAGAAFERFSAGSPRPAALCAVLLAALCAVEARRDVLLWRDGETLWRHAFAQDCSSPMFAYRLGETLMFDRGRVDEAIAYFRIQQRLDPDKAEARKVLGYAYNRRGYDLLKAGRRKAAIASFETALAYDPSRREIAANLAMAKRQKGIIGE